MNALRKQDRQFYRTLWSLAVPILLQNLVTQCLSLTDTFMVGLLGERQLAAVTLANTPFFVVLMMIFGMQSGGGVLASQYWGKGDKAAISRILGIALYVAFGAGMVIALAAALIPEVIVGLVTNNQDLADIAVGYMRIVGWSYLFNAVSAMFVGIHRSVGNAKFGLILYSCSMALNTFLNWVLIFGKLGAPALGVEGAALATLIARIFEFLVAVVYVARSRVFRPDVRLMLRPGAAMTRDFIRYATPVVVNETLWGLGTSLYQVIMGHMDGSTAIMAAYTIAGNVEKLCTTATLAIGSATTIMVGTRMGAGDEDGAYQTGSALNFLTTAVAVVIALALASLISTFIAPVVYPKFDLSADARTISTAMLVVLCFTMPFKGFNTTNIIGVVRGGGDVRTAMYIDVGFLYGLSIPAAALAGLVFGWGITVVYSCILLEEICKALVGYWRFRSKKWMLNLTRA
jgi:putative MATE family efflux protein